MYHDYIPINMPIRRLVNTPQFLREKNVTFEPTARIHRWLKLLELQQLHHLTLQLVSQTLNAGTRRHGGVM